MKPLGLDPEDPLVRSAVFGKQVQDFLQGEIGDYLIKRAEGRLKTLLDMLKDHNPEDPYGLSKLQAEIKYLEGFERWLGDAVQEGLNAQNIIEEEDDAN